MATGTTAAARTVDETAYAHRYLIAAAVALASLLQVIDTSIVNVAIPKMMGNFGASLDEISRVSTAYIVASVIVIPMTGWLGTFFGRKRYFIGSIILFTAASVLCGLSRSLQALVLWRIVQGIGGGALLSTSQAILYDAFPKEEVGTGLALWGMGVMVGPTLGPTLGGWLTDNYSWPWIFYINLPFGIFAAVMIALYVRDPAHHPRSRSIDFAGIGLLALTVGSLQWMLERGERFDWFDSRLVVVLAFVSVLGAALLIWRELTATEPVIDFRVLKNPQFSIGVFMGVLLGAGLLGSVFILPVFLQGMLRMTAWQTGRIILPGALASAVSMMLVGRLTRRLDNRLLVTFGSMLFCLAMWRLSHVTSESGAGEFFWPLILRGFGLGMVFVPLTNLTLAQIERKDMAQATGLFNFFRQIGGSFSIAVMASLLTRYTIEKHAMLVEHVSVDNPEAISRIAALTHGFVARGMDAFSAREAALRILDQQVMAQANVLAFSRIYLLSGAILFFSLPLLLLFRKPRPGEPAAAAHIIE